MLNAFYLLNMKLIKGHRGTKLAKEKTFWAYQVSHIQSYVLMYLRHLSDTQITIFPNHVTAYDCPELISFMDSF